MAVRHDSGTTRIHAPYLSYIHFITVFSTATLGLAFETAAAPSLFQGRI